MQSIKKVILFLLLSLCSHQVFGQVTINKSFPSDTFENPRSTMQYFLKTMKAYKEGNKNALDLAIKTFNTSELDDKSQIVSSKLAARRLIQTIDRIKYVKIHKIPKYPKSDKWIFSKINIVNNNSVLKAEIAIGKTKDKKWLFTPQTLKTIEAYHLKVADHKIVKGVITLNDFRTRFKSSMPEFTSIKTFEILNGQWLSIFLIVLIGLILKQIVNLLVNRFTHKLFFKNNIQLTEKKKKRLTFPIGLIVIALTWIILIPLIELDDKLLSFLLRMANILMTVAIVLTAHHIVDVVAIYFQELAKKSDNKFDDILVPLLRKAGKTFVLAIGLIAIGNSLSLDMKSLLAGLGIGGIAFALAAKDTISNLFGSLTVLLDRPFRIGDWVQIDGGVEGSIEEVGLRSTRVRTSYDSLVSVPNGTLTNSYIDNYGQRTYRRFSTHIGIEYGTPPHLIEAFCEGIRQIILSHQWTRKDMFHVYLNQLGASSLDILLYCFWKVPNRSTELSERHRLLIDILRLGEEMGISFAFPTQTLHMQNTESTLYQEENSGVDAYQYGKSKAKDITKDPYTMKKPRSGAIDPEDKLGL
ncbi:MAG: mechanosensitive ion channel family protein [Bacteriovoracaceae bacterium]|nr:mechanosensitive ion channel family protein [Bacteriovoracaceae bacterium]